MKVTINGTFYAKVTNETTGEERVATMSITNIDSNKPVIEKLETSNKQDNEKDSQITVTATAKDNETGLPEQEHTNGILMMRKNQKQQQMKIIIHLQELQEDKG